MVIVGLIILRSRNNSTDVVKISIAVTIVGYDVLRAVCAELVADIVFRTDCQCFFKHGGICCIGCYVWECRAVVMFGSAVPLA